MELGDEIDYAALRDPLLINVRAVSDYVNVINNGTAEVKHILSKEVDVILECRVCRKLFRSLANLIMHKRKFCKRGFGGPCLKFPEFVSKPDTVILQPDDLDRVDGSTNSDDVESTVVDGNLQGLSAECQDLTNAFERPQCKSDNVNVVKLEKIDTNANAVYQTVETIDKENVENQLSLSEPETEKEENSVDEGNWKSFCDTVTLTCNICDQKYSSLKTLKFHCLHLHGKVRTFYPCLYCKLLFCQPWSCRRHMERSHQKTREQVLKLNDLIKKKSFTVPLDDLNEKGMPKVDPREQSKLVVKMPRKEKPKMKLKVERVKQDVEDKKRNKRESQEEVCVKRSKKETPCASPVPDSPSSFPCFNCGREYDVKGSLNKHLHRRSCFDQDSLTDKKPKRRELSTVLNNEQLKKVNKLIDRNRMQCRRCNRKFTNVSNLNRHAIRHVGISRFKCDICDFRCYNMGECRRHLLNTHRKTDYQRYIIDIEDVDEDSPPILKDVKTPTCGKDVKKFAVGVSSSRRKQDLSIVRNEYGISTRNSPKRLLVESHRTSPARFTRRTTHLKPENLDMESDDLSKCDDNDGNSVDTSVNESVDIKPEPEPMEESSFLTTDNEDIDSGAVADDSELNIMTDV